MLFMINWKTRPDTIREAVARFLATGAKPLEGGKSLGRWHRADISGGWHLIEADNVGPIQAHCAEWADLLELSAAPVPLDAEAGPAMAKAFGGK
jgi:hypothetical protein